MPPNVEKLRDELTITLPPKKEVPGCKAKPQKQNMNPASDDVIAEFRSLKKLLLEGNANFIFSDKKINGPTLYLLGISKLNGFFGERDKKAAKEYLESASAQGHLPSKLVSWKAQDSFFRKLQLWAYIPYNFVKFVYIARNCPTDIRVLC